MKKHFAILMLTVILVVTITTVLGCDKITVTTNEQSQEDIYDIPSDIVPAGNATNRNDTKELIPKQQHEGTGYNKFSEFLRNHKAILPIPIDNKQSFPMVFDGTVCNATRPGARAETDFFIR